MKRLTRSYVLGLVGTLVFLSWSGRAVAEQPRAHSTEAAADVNTPILPPIASGDRHDCANPPDRATILRALPRVAQGIPYIYEESRDNLEFTVECLVDRVDAPRFYPLVGPAQLHHCHYKCT